MVEENVGDGEGVVELAVAHKGHCRDHADALLPERPAAAGEVVKERAVLVEEPFAEKGIAAEVHEVPVVDVLRVAYIKVDALLSDRFLDSLRMAKDLHQRQERREADLVILAGDAFLQIVKTGGGPAGLDDGSGYGNLDSQKLVALAVLAGAGFEKAAEPFDLRRVGRRVHLFS